MKIKVSKDSSSMRVVVEVPVGPEKGKVFEFSSPNRVFVGRLSSAHIQVNDPYISRMHFLLELTSSHCYVWDLNSTNGTYVNGKRVWGSEVRDEDLILIGKTVFQLKIEEEEIIKYFCSFCGRDITDSLASVDGIDELDKEDLLCEECLKRFGYLLELKKEETKINEPMTAPCFSCGQHKVKNANDDRRYDELEDIALYLCNDCVEKFQDININFNELEDYRILKELAEGVFGKVYLALHKKTNRLVALKKMRAELTLDEKSGKLFQREMKILQNLIHPNIVRLIDQGVVDGEHYFISEYLPVGDIEYLKGEKNLHLQKFMIICQILEGLEYAHQMGYVHRDIKPSNILLTKDGMAKISDFGLARNYEKHESGIDRTGEVKGSSLFMSPELLLNYKYVKPSADVYSVGCTLYYLLTGELPYEYTSRAHNLIESILSDKRIPVERKIDIPEPLARVVNKSIMRNEDNRYASAKEMKEEIEAALDEV